MHSILIATLLTGIAAATPVLTPRGEGTTFALITSVTDAPDAVKELNGRIWAISSNADGHAVLVDRTEQSIFYQYAASTDSAVATGNTGIVITPGGTATVPSLNTINLVPEISTHGVEISNNEQGIPTLQYQGGGFMACRASFLDPEAQNPDDFVLSYRKDGQRRFADCAEVVLISNCRGGGDVGGSPLGEPVTVGCQPH
ncbi:hypothetical protein BS50DRAFT_571871 [Corynespora cassiicola Philippines]|uniref:DUF7907 domain-containing protein n=1 Tax=Corynespora cassiicola Philippines TaxID=1448308 RepID=A0A2T2NT89_CORCC|nr:hypothetical protein BS50DRAFT_571871 [Corynespora cassiicola Philippines]